MQKVYSLQEIRRLVGFPMDRVSLYRILNAFCDTGILFKLTDSKGNICYIFNYFTASSGKKIASFMQCTCCNKLVQLPDFPQNYIELLKEYQILNLHMLFAGVCSDCRSEPTSFRRRETRRRNLQVD